MELAVAGVFDSVTVTATTAAGSPDATKTITASSSPLRRDPGLPAVALRIGETFTARSNPVRLRESRNDDAPSLHLYWGDLHGMMFNHRPLAEYFLWGRDVARLDWAGGQLFSYGTSVNDVWEAFKDV